MRIRMTLALAATAMLWAGCASAQTRENKMADPAPVIAKDHALLASDDPRLAANKRLVYDMYRIVLQAGIWERAGEFIADGYIQHNPNAGQGLSGVQEYIRKTRPERPISDKLELPLIQLIAEGDYVMTAFVRPEKDAAGETYYSTWFDLYRIENGKIAEHWDPMLKSDTPIDPNTRKL
jgi:predicted SnoaL-like aldol condensation-catalyzing enzyme